MKISVKVRTGAREEKIEEEEFKVSVKEQPEKDKTNMAIIKIVADYFNLSPNDIKIVSGKKSSRKVLKLRW